MAGVRWGREADVVIVGTGAAALTAAILAHDNGASVRLIEQSDQVGGVSAISGGGLWVPNNHHMAGYGADDSRDAALAYMRFLAGSRVPDDRIVTYVDTAPAALKYLEAHTPLNCSACAIPDYHPEGPGGTRGGRCVEANLFDTNQLGDWAKRLRVGRVFELPFMIEEMFITYKLMYNPGQLPFDLINQRIEAGLVATGNALIGSLLKGCLDREIPIDLETEATELVRDGKRIVGVSTRQDGKTTLYSASAVILASGGFEWDADLRKKFINAPTVFPASPPISHGAALRMAMDVGADLSNMTEAWWLPGLIDPAETYEGEPLVRLGLGERTAPHSIMVNSKGRRFANEAANYNDLGKAFNYFDPNEFGYANTPAWIVVDSQFRERYPIIMTMPTDPDPEWLIRGATLEQLAEKAGIDSAGLTQTVQRFNTFARNGTDEDFNRGLSFFDRFMGDQDAPHPTLGALERPPFYAFPVYHSTLGTKGGATVNTSCQILDVWGEPIPGLYGAGNAVGSVLGPAYAGGGATIGCAVVDGYLAGRSAATQTRG